MSLAQLFLISMTLLMNSSHFYQSLYTSKSTPNNKNNVTSFLNKLDLPHISEDSKAKLNCDFTRAEILTSLKSLNLNRSPGYDDLPAEFYVVFFNDICDMLVDCYQYSFDQGFMSMTQCNGVITGTFALVFAQLITVSKYPYISFQSWCLLGYEQMVYNALRQLPFPVLPAKVATSYTNI